MARLKSAYFPLNKLGFHSNQVRVSSIYAKIKRNRDYLIVKRYYGPSEVTWELLSSELKKIWLVCFDTELTSLLDEWSTTRLYSIRIILKQDIIRRFALLYTRVQFIVDENN